MKRGFNKTQKNYIIGSLIAIVLIMTVAFSAFSTSLNIQGTSKVDSKWDVEIVSITPNSTANKVENTYATSGDITHSITNNLTANFSAVLISPGDSVVYTIAVENKGTLDAQLDSITKNLGNNSDITFTISGINESSLPEKLAANSTKEFTVTVTFVNNPAGQGNPTNKTSSFSLTMNYSQYDGSSSVSGSGGLGDTNNSTFTGTVYRNNENRLFNGKSMDGTTKIYYSSSAYSSVQDALDEMVYYFSEEDCLEDDNDSCSVESVTINIGSYETDADNLDANFYLKHEIVNGIVEASYVCFISDTEHCLQGGNASFYTANKNILNSDANKTWFSGQRSGRCKDSSTSFMCSSPSITASADIDGQVVTYVNGKKSCIVIDYGESECT